MSAPPSPCLPACLPACAATIVAVMVAAATAAGTTAGEGGFTVLPPACLPGNLRSRTLLRVFSDGCCPQLARFQVVPPSRLLWHSCRPSATLHGSLASPPHPALLPFPCLLQLRPRVRAPLLRRPVLLSCAERQPCGSAACSGGVRGAGGSTWATRGKAATCPAARAVAAGLPRSCRRCSPASVLHDRRCVPIHLSFLVCRCVTSCETLPSQQR